MLSSSTFIKRPEPSSPIKQSLSVMLGSKARIAVHNDERMSVGAVSVAS